MFMLPFMCLKPIFFILFFPFLFLFFFSSLHLSYDLILSLYKHLTSSPPFSYSILFLRVSFSFESALTLSPSPLFTLSPCEFFTSLHLTSPHFTYIEQEKGK